MLGRSTVKRDFLPKGCDVFCLMRQLCGRRCLQTLRKGSRWIVEMMLSRANLLKVSSSRVIGITYAVAFARLSWSGRNFYKYMYEKDWVETLLKAILEPIIKHDTTKFSESPMVINELIFPLNKTSVELFIFKRINLNTFRILFRWWWRIWVFCIPIKPINTTNYSACRESVTRRACL